MSYSAERGSERFQLVKSTVVKVGKAEADCYEEYGQDGLRLFTWPAITAGGTLTGDVSITAAIILSGGYSADGGAQRALTLVNADVFVAALDSPKVGLGGDFYVINLGTVNADEPLVLTQSGDASMTVSGNGEVINAHTTPATHLASGSGHFRWRITALGSSPAVVFYRLG